MRVNIVGAKFHPPAAGVLGALPSGWPLVLVADRGNEYDEKAIRVLVDLRDFPLAGRETLQSAVEGFGWQADELCGQEDPCWLGFLAKSGAKTTGGGPGNGEVWEALGAALAIGVGVELCFDGNGYPQAEIFPVEGALVPDLDWCQRRPFNE
jgi:hypothetical protein